jgi:hypothetical protein
MATRGEGKGGQVATSGGKTAGARGDGDVGQEVGTRGGATRTGFDPSWITFLRYCNVLKKN